MTAKEYIVRMLETYPMRGGTSFRIVNSSDKQIETCMIAFAKDRVRDALDAAANKATIIDDPNSYTGNTGSEYELDKIVSRKSILNAYPLDNIK